MNKSKYIPICIIGTLLSLIVYGLTLSILWEWFLVPLGLPEITGPHAYGIAIMIALVLCMSLAKVVISANDNSPENNVIVCWSGVIASPVALAAGAIARALM